MNNDIFDENENLEPDVDYSPEEEFVDEAGNKTETESRAETKSGPVFEAVYEPVIEKETHKRNDGFGIGKVIAIALCCALLGGIFGGAGAAAIISRSNNKTAVESAGTVYESQREETKLDNAVVKTAEMSDAEIYSNCVASTVGITTAMTVNYWGYTTTTAASGSGFVYTDSGYIITNYHVVEGAEQVSVALYDGRSFDAQLIGYDSGSDIAVLKIDADGLVPAVIGSSDALSIGDHVVAIGNPLGELTFSLTQGAVSSLGRQITGLNDGQKLIQTDCAINSGNSGGALFNDHGEVIGITNAKLSRASNGVSIDNIGFAIPIDTARPIADNIIELGYVVKPYIGVTVSDVSADAIGFGLPAGAAVQDVTKGSPADEAGLKQMDIITAVDDTEVDGMQSLVEIIRSSTPGQTLELHVYRSGETLTLPVTIGEQTQAAIIG